MTNIVVPKMRLLREVLANDPDSASDRSGDEGDHFWAIFVQSNGFRVYVLSNGNGTSATVILEGPLTTDPVATAIEAISDSTLASRIADGRWTPVGEF